MESKENSVFKKIHKVMHSITTIPKLGTNEYHNYDYVREVEVVNEIRNLFIENNLILLPSLSSISKDDTLTTVIMNYNLVDIDTGDEVILSSVGQGFDSNDKGAPKAIVSALKYFLLKLFLIPTSDDPEGDSTSDQKSETVSKAKIKAGKQAGNSYSAQILGMKSGKSSKGQKYSYLGVQTVINGKERELKHFINKEDPSLDEILTDLGIDPNTVKYPVPCNIDVSFGGSFPEIVKFSPREESNDDPIPF